MALGIRGFNPIWSEVDLQGNLFDDTFYLFVLENTIPYIPATVYHDPDLNTPWTNPIQFLANGTLPNDIFFETDTVYRLEFRQGSTQSDPLIYEVNDYIAGEGGSTPVDSSFASENQVTNPQFALINFESPLVVSGTDPDPIQIGPGWVLELGGTGTATITQVALTSTNSNPSNAPYALQLTLAGWDDGEVFLRQRFQQNGMLWANKTVSSTITAMIDGSPQGISATLVDSDGPSTLAQVLAVPNVNSEWNEYTGHGTLGDTGNTDTPPSAYIDYKLALPSNVDIYLTSIQLIVQDENDLAEPAFEQDSINRQIDHTYNTAYPIIPVGTVIDFGGFAIPSHYLFCDGTAYNRTTYNLLFQALTIVETVTLTSGVATFTVVSSTDYHIGIPAATTIANKSGTTITMSANATVSGSSDVRFFAVGAGNGTTTFNVPDLLNYVVAGAGASIFGVANSGVGAKSGSSTHTLTVDELATHHHASSTGSGFIVAGGIVTLSAGAGSSESVVANTADTGLNTPFSVVQPTYLMKKCIRFE